MKLTPRLRPSLVFLAAALLVGGLPSKALALYSIMIVSREKAKDLGITVRSKPSANNDAWVQVEFKAAGRMKGFNWADLELTKGGKRLVTASLKPTKPAGDSPEENKMLQFYIDPAALPDTTVTIFVADAGLGGTGYQLRMKDFLPPAATPRS